MAFSPAFKCSSFGLCPFGFHGVFRFCLSEWFSPVRIFADIHTFLWQIWFFLWSCQRSLWFHSKTDITFHPNFSPEKISVSVWSVLRSPPVFPHLAWRLSPITTRSIVAAFGGSAVSSVMVGSYSQPFFAYCCFGFHLIGFFRGISAAASLIGSSAFSKSLNPISPKCLVQSVVRTEYPLSPDLVYTRIRLFL